MSTEHPIIFSGPMVRAILDGRKSMTRRVIKPQPKWLTKPGWWTLRLPRGRFDHLDFCRREDEEIRQLLIEFYLRYKPGDVLWVREGWRLSGGPEKSWVLYKSSGETVMSFCGIKGNSGSKELNPEFGWKMIDRYGCHYRPSIHMPRWAARLFLEVISVRPERLQDITNLDAFAEGITSDDHEYCRAEHAQLGGVSLPYSTPERQAFSELWDSLNAKRGYSWESNDWVWKIEFKKLDSREPVKD